MPSDTEQAQAIIQHLRQNGCNEKHITRTIMTLETNFSLHHIYARTKERWILDRHIIMAFNVTLNLNNPQEHDGRLLKNAVYIIPGGKTPEEQYEFGKKMISRIDEFFVDNISLHMQPITHTEGSKKAFLLKSRDGKTVLGRLIPEDLPPGTVLIRGPGLIYMQALVWALKERIDTVFDWIQNQPTPLVAPEYLRAHNTYHRRLDRLYSVLSSHQPRVSPTINPEFEAYFQRMFRVTPMVPPPQEPDTSPNAVNVSF